MQFSSGIADGQSSSWDENGALLACGANQLGKKVGIWYERQPDGTLKTIDYGE